MQWRIQGGGGVGGRPIDLTNFCINVKSNPRMHQNPPVSGKNSIFFLGRGHSPLPSTVRPHYKILDPPLATRKFVGPSVYPDCLCARTGILKTLRINFHDFLGGKDKGLTAACCPLHKRKFPPMWRLWLQSPIRLTSLNLEDRGQGEQQGAPPQRENFPKIIVGGRG